MNKCFITKLPSSVDNNTLPVLGQLKIKWLKQNTLTDNDARAIDLQTNSSITVKVSGAHFTDSTLASNIGNTKIITATDGVVSLYVSNDVDAVLTIDNKYSLLYLGFAHNGKSKVPKSVYFDIEDIRGCTNIQWLYLSSTQVSGDISAVRNLVNLKSLVLNDTKVSGDISAVSNLTKLVSIYIDYTQITGDISAVSNLTNLTALAIGYTQVSGDISAVRNLVNLTSLILNDTKVSGDISAVSNLVNLSSLVLDYIQVSGDISAVSNLTNLEYLGVSSTKVSGDISAVSNLTNLTALTIGYTQITGNISAVRNLTKLTALSIGYTQITGAVDYLVGLTKLVDLDIKNISLTGNMSMIPINVVFISQLGRNIITNFTWTANGRFNAKLLAMEGPVPFDTVSMDNMLIDQATCTFTPAASIPWLNVISVSGNRTSASDAAVATIQSKGVTITGVNKVS